MPPLKYRYYQQEADKAIYEELVTRGNTKCLVKMFCGVGKSLIMRNCRVAQHIALLVYVFPSLSLIKQFREVYLAGYTKSALLEISSYTSGTTNAAEIRKFLSSKKKEKIILITYASFATLLEQLIEPIDVCIFDEAHHVVGETYQQLIFNSGAKKQIFFTATPKNANDIIMWNKDDTNLISDCGNMAYEYTYVRGVVEGYLNSFELRVDFFGDMPDNSVRVYETIARAILTSRNTRVLTFHSDVANSVLSFVNQAAMQSAFERVMAEEFPGEEVFKGRRIKMVGFCSGKPDGFREDILWRMEDRSVYLAQFDAAADDEITIISSCETLSEGVDTKRANMCVFADPKSAYVKIIQNIGRIVRKTEAGVMRPGTVLLPIAVDKTKYADCEDDPEKRDEVLRAEMSEKGGDFQGILNVVSALRQEDPDLYEMCLYYPNRFSPQEIEKNLEKQGYEVGERVGEGYLEETLEYLLDETEEENSSSECSTEENISIDFSEEEECSSQSSECSSEEDNSSIYSSGLWGLSIEEIAEENNVRIDVHTDNLERPIETYGKENSERIINILKEENEEEEREIYYPILPRVKQQKQKLLNKPYRIIGMGMHMMSDIQVLWKIKESDLTYNMCEKYSAVLECEVIDVWNKNLEKVKEFIYKNKKRPSKH